MSYTELIGADENGDFKTSLGEFGNSHLFSPIIWNYFSAKAGFVREMFSAAGPLMKLAEPWDLWKLKAVPMAGKICFAFTFDGCYVKRENVPKLIAALREAASMPPVPQISLLDGFSKTGEAVIPEHAHLNPIADALENLPEGITAVGLHGTSVCCNPWSRYVEEDDDYQPVNMAKDEVDANGNGIFELFENFQEAFELLG